MGSKSEGTATEAQFKEVNKRYANFTKPVLPKYDNVVAQAGGEPAKVQDARYGAQETIACDLCGDHSQCKQRVTSCAKTSVRMLSYHRVCGGTLLHEHLCGSVEVASLACNCALWPCTAKGIARVCSTKCKCVC